VITENIENLLPRVKELAIEAGNKILEIYQSDFAIRTKDDKTPLTDADMAAHKIIIEGIVNLSPDIPALSEESGNIDFSVRKNWETYWLIDPLDGTKEFINRNGEFTVNIALIHEHKPILGVIYAPVKGLLYYAGKNLGAYKSELPNDAVKINSKKVSGTILSIVGSRSHGGVIMNEFLAKLHDAKILTMGSSLKSCLVAEGTADIYPRFGPTSEWDTAAAQCIVEEAGGKICTIDTKPLLYNTKESLLNPYFLVIGDPGYAWLDLMPESARQI